MPNVSNNFRTHYLDELDALRHEGIEFARNHPDVAKELGFGFDQWKDPQAEMLAQSFAYLTARLRNQLDVDRSAVPNALLNHLYPHLQAPTPCMAILEANMVMQNANGRPIERGRTFSIESESAKRKALCRFSNCYETPIWPLIIEDIESVQANSIDLPDKMEVSSLLKIQIRTDPKSKISDLSIRENGLRFFITGTDTNTQNLYQALSTSLKGVLVVIPDQQTDSESKDAAEADKESGAQNDSQRAKPVKSKGQFLNARNLTWRGFGKDEAALPDGDTSNPGYRLIQEYFAFPEKFMFFDIENIDVSNATAEINIFLLLGDAINEVNKDSLKLNCFPAVNLYKQAIEPVRLTRRKYEYQIEVDRSNLQNSEIYQILDLYSVVNGEAPKPISPCYELSAFDADEDNEYFYSYRRENYDSDKIPGTKSYISLLDLNMDICKPPAEAIGGMALCTNRRIPEKLFVGNELVLEGAGPIATARLITGVTNYRAPDLTGNAPWQLVSRLSLNFLSLVEQQGDDDLGGLKAFKSILRIYTDTQNQLVWKQINSLRSLKARRISRMVHSMDSSGLVHGLEITLEVSDGDFKGISAVLFASVCRYFFVLYASLGTFVELILISSSKREEWKRWPPMAGALVDL